MTMKNIINVKQSGKAGGDKAYQFGILINNHGDKSNKGPAYACHPLPPASIYGYIERHNNFAAPLNAKHKESISCSLYKHPTGDMHSYIATSSSQAMYS